MKKVRVILLYVTVFALIFAGTVSFLQMFMPDESPILGYVDWESYVVVNGDGVPHPFDPNDAVPQWEWQEGQIIRLTGRLPEYEAMPRLYEGTGCILMECSGMELCAAINGKERLRLDSDGGEATAPSQVNIILSADDAGGELTVQYTPYTESAVSSPFFARFSGEDAIYRFAYASAAESAVPAGWYALEFVLICGIFLFGLAEGTPERTLPFLALAAFLMAAFRLNGLSGFYFLPRPLYSLLASQGMRLAVPAILTLYLCLNRRRLFWRYLFRVTACTLPAMAVWYGIDRLRDGRYARTVEAVLGSLFRGSPDALVYHLCIYLTTVCIGIAVYSYFREQFRIRTEAGLIAMRGKMAVENYRRMEQNLHGTALMRHEWRNQVATLHMLAAKGDYGELEQVLTRLDSRLRQIAMPHYSDNFTVNIILQNTAMQAEELDVTFSASAPLPERLDIEEGDLVSLLINMLDNALKAASMAGDRREAEIRLGISRSFLTVICENTYNGVWQTDGEGRPVSTKPDPGQHGLGIAQMRHIAEKYGGILDITRTDHRVTVQTALSMNKLST